jgi:hypothetical protein
MSYNAQANGNIYPSRFVSIDPAALGAGDFKVIEDIVVAQPVFGVSQPGTDYPPLADSHVTVAGYAAIAGEQLLIYTDGDECTLELAGTVTAGDLLKANATTDGKAIAVVAVGSQTTPQYYGAQALQGGVSGEKIKCRVKTGVITQHA